VVFKNIRLKKPGGGTRMQRVEVLKSGKFKFVKNLKTRAKSAARKVKSKVTRRRSPKKTIKKKSSNKGSMAGKFGLNKVFGNPTLRKILMASGAVTIATSVAALVAPQFVPTIQKPIAKAVLGFLAGDFIGAIANFVLGSGAITQSSNNGAIQSGNGAFA